MRQVIGTNKVIIIPRNSLHVGGQRLTDPLFSVADFAATGFGALAHDPDLGDRLEITSIVTDLEDNGGTRRVSERQTFLTCIPEPSQVPERASQAMIGMGLVGLVAARRRRSN